MLKVSHLALAVLLPVSFAVAQNATVSVLHGIPGLASPVDVFANGRKLFSFDYGDFRGPLSLTPGVYKLEVKLGTTTVLDLDPNLAADTNYTVVAHLKEKTGIALSAFANDLDRIDKYDARLYVRHLANAPAVDVYAKRYWRESRIFANVRNGQEGKVDVDAGTWSVRLTAAGNKETAFGPAKLELGKRKLYAVYAIGELGKDSFRLFVQTIEAPVELPQLATRIRGKACGGKISLSTSDVEFDRAFDVILTGGTKDGFGFLHTGTSDNRFLVFRLPLELDFLGARGCFLYQNTPGIMPVRLDGNGQVSVSQRIPAGMAAHFREVHYQFSFVSQGANPANLLLTDYASVEREDD